MNVGEMMELIAQEAQRQGFLVRQTRESAWQFRLPSTNETQGHNWFFLVRDPQDVLYVVGVLCSDAGFSWPAWRER